MAMEQPAGWGGRVRLAHFELLSGLLFIPWVVASGFAVLGLPWWARWSGGLEWRRTRHAGADLPVEPPGRGLRPLVLLGVSLAGHLAAFCLLTALGGLGLGLLAAPLVVWIAPAGAVYDFGL
ncbi:hypothetical protein AAEX63_04275 [Luteococcus sp. H138]|uniref:hypothetical protein n=1 Tax=unclassified Luteococcus TaxID=2639923 RepID=UPI00313AA163